jgi:hypothetical protein
MTEPAMRLSSYFIGDRVSYGVVMDAGIIDRGHRFGDRHPDLRSVLAANAIGFHSLAPVDVIATGTPSGVGYARKPPIYMKQGDTVENQIGTLRNPVVKEDLTSRSR